jgi:hypothetical protein
MQGLNARPQALSSPEEPALSVAEQGSLKVKAVQVKLATCPCFVSGHDFSRAGKVGTNRAHTLHIRPGTCFTDLVQEKSGL